MGLRAFYYKQEEKYFKFLDNLEKKGINLYKIVDPLEKHGIPTFLLFNLIILLLIIFLVFMFVGTTPTTDESYALKFVDNQNEPIINQSFNILFGSTKKQLVSDAYGAAIVSDVKKEKITLGINSDKYLIETPQEINFSEKLNFTVTLKLKIKTLSKTINFKSNNELYSSPLTVSSITCSGNEDYIKSDISINDGIITLTDIPSDCGYLQVSIESSTVNALESLEVNEDNAAGEVNLSFEAMKLGDGTITVLDKDLKVPVSNVSVSIYNMQSQAVREGVTNTNGVVYFNAVSVGTYYVVIYDDDDRYKPISELDSVQISFVDGALATSEVLIEKAFIGKLKFKVVNAITKEPVLNVTTSLYKGNVVIKTETTDDTGLVSFGVEENISYKVVFNNESYILKTENNLRINDNVKPISLVPITNENIRSLIITVKDVLLSPVDFATVRLWDADEGIVLQTMTADIYGKVIVTNLDTERTYKLDAVKGKFTSDYTNPFKISEQEINEQTIKMVIGEGTFNLILKSEFGENYSGNIYVYDSSNDMILNDKTTTTNQDGFTLIKIRADKQVYFAIDNFESQFITPRYSIDASEVKNLEFTLPRSSNTSGIEFLGFYDATGEKINSVAPGAQVTARFILNVTKSFSKVTAHIRTGETPNPLCSTRSYNVSEDNLFIKDVRYSKSDVLGSLTYTPCLGQTTDFSNKTLRNAKWFNLTIKNPVLGSHLIEADIIVLDTAFTNQAVNYRAEFYKGASVVRTPVDTSLVSTSTKQTLYAQSKQVQLFTGSYNQCTSLLCYSFIITNTQTNLSKSIVDKYNAQINNDYRLSFSLNMMDLKIAPDAVLLVTTGSSVVLKEYIINSSSGSILRSDDFSEISLGNLTSNDLVTGEVNFKVVDDVSDTINFTVVSNGQEVFSKSILIDIKAAKKMTIEYVPRKIVPFLTNNMMISVSDDSNVSVKNANVAILLNNETIETGVTNDQGLFGFILPAPNVSDVLRIIVTKNEYRMQDIELVIDDKLITPVPKEITLTLDASRDVKEIYNFSLINETYVPLTVMSIEQTAASEYVDLKFNLTDSLIDNASQADVELSATLTEKGINLYTQETFKTDVLIKFKNTELNKIWTVTIPVTVRIVLGNSLDSLDCLKILPVEGTLRTKSNEATTLDFTLENKCTVNSRPVDLGQIMATLDWKNKSEVGTFSISVSNKEAILENLVDTLVISSLPRNSKTTMQLKFKAYKINSAVETPIINFKSTKGNINGVDVVETSLKTNVIVNDYSTCIEIPKQAVPILGCNWFGGYGMYNQYHGQNNFGQMNQMNNPYYGGNNFTQSYNMNNQYNRNNQYQQGSGYYTQQQGYNYPQYNLVGQTGYTGTQASSVNPYNYPTGQAQNMSGYNNNYNFSSGYPQGNYGAQGNTNNMNCPVRPTYIKNNCLEAVDLKLDPNYGITITSDAEFSLNPGDSEEVLLMGGEEMGSFNIPVSVKPSVSSSTAYSLVGKIPVSVTLPISFMPSKCIQVTPQKLDFSNIVDPKYQIVKVMNSCFSEGYRLVEVNYLDLMDLNFDGVSFLNVGEMQGRIQPIKVDYLTDLKTNDPIEVWEIALRRNPEISKTISAKEYLNKYKTNSVAAGLVSTFRRMLIDVEDTVNLKFILSVGLQSPQGQSSIIYNNIGMQLTDNFQWLILDNKDNWDILNEFTGDQDMTDEELEFVDTSVKLTYKIDSARNAVFIQVPEAELAFNKFKQIDQEPEVTRCFFGYVKDFPITGIKETSHIKDIGLFYLPDTYDPLKVSIEFVTRNKNVFKLCFTRPVEAFENDFVINSKLPIYDLFKEKFELWAINEESSKTYLQGHTFIGVDTKVATNELSFIEPSDPNADSDDLDTQDLILCNAPDLSENQDGFTGTKAYEKYGFDKILFEYSNITGNTCNEYYCDQEQFYDYLKFKANGLDDLSNTTNFVKLGDIYFEIANNTIKVNPIKVNLCDGVCDAFSKGDNSINAYVTSAESLLNNIPDELKEITIIKTHKLTVNGSNIISLGGYNYTTVKYFLDNYNDLGLTSEDKVALYSDMEVYFGASPQVFTSNLKKFSQTKEEYNNKILIKYNNNIYKKYDFEYTEDKNILVPGTYIVKLLNINDNNVSITIGDLVNGISDDYKQNILFYMPINPDYQKSLNVLRAPYLPEYIKTTYTTDNWSSLQEGYIFTLKDMVNYNFTNSRPFYFSKNYALKLIEVSENNTEIASLDVASKLFLLSDNTNQKVTIYANPKFTQYTKVFAATTNNDNQFTIYNLNMNNVSPRLTYNNMTQVFNEIKNNNVCFMSDSSEIKLWHNPDNFKNN